METIIASKWFIFALGAYIGLNAGVILICCLSFTVSRDEQEDEPI